MEEKITEYDKYQLMWEALKGTLMGKFNNTQDTTYLDILILMQKFEKVE